jgi:hypothetical protein
MASSRTPQRVASAVSWMSLLAAATLGVSGVNQVRARISTGEELVGDGELRLIVQSYPKDRLTEGRPERYAQPLASTQRSITPEELKRGIDVSFLELGAEATDSDSVVVAWVERGSANLDLDALEARPAEGSFYGVGRGTGDDLVVRLART